MDEVTQDEEVAVVDDPGITHKTPLELLPGDQIGSLTVLTAPVVVELDEEDRPEYVARIRAAGLEMTDEEPLYGFILREGLETSMAFTPGDNDLEVTGQVDADELAALARQDALVAATLLLRAATQSANPRTLAVTIEPVQDVAYDVAVAVTPWTAKPTITITRRVVGAEPEDAEDVTEAVASALQRATALQNLMNMLENLGDDQKSGPTPDDVTQALMAHAGPAL